MVRILALMLLLVGSAAAAPSSPKSPAVPVLVAPVLLSSAVPAWPEDAPLDLGPCTVSVRLIIDPAGKVTQVDLVTGRHPAVDRVVMDAARTMEFQPGTADGIAVAVTVDISFDILPPPPPPAGIRGQVLDQATLHPLPGVQIGLGEATVVSDPDGRFALDAPPGEARLVYWKEGFERLVDVLTLPPGEEVTVESILRRARHGEPETVVRVEVPVRVVERAPLAAPPGASVGRWSLTSRDVELSPGSMGDVGKAVHQLPSVAADGDLFATFSVRGGDPDETRFLLDGLTLEHPNHLGGTFTLFHPKAAEHVELWTGAPPAALGDALAGALSVDYLDGDRERWDGSIDLNMAMGNALFTGPLGPKGSPATFAVALRRSWFELYLAMMRGVGLIPADTDFNVVFGEYWARVAVGTGRHRLRFSAFHAHDRLRIGADPTGQAVLSLDNALDFGAATTGTVLDGRWQASPKVELGWRVSLLREAEERQQAAGFDVIRRVETWRPELRLEGRFRPASGQEWHLGIDVLHRSTAGDGTIKDPRAAPPWAALPWADLGAPALVFDASRSWTEFNVFLDGDWRSVGGGPFDLRVGLLASPWNATGLPLFSPRGGVALRLPTATTFKLSGAWLHSIPRDPVYYDPSVGAADLLAERTLQAALAVEQLLPFGALIRLEGHAARLDHLLVHPDDPARWSAGESFQSVGVGWTAGLDAFFGMRVGRVGAVASYALLFAERTNPLHTLGPKTYEPAFVARHAWKLGGDVVLGKRKNVRIAAAWEIRNGRPRTEVAPFQRGDGGWSVLARDYNQARYGPFHELSVRVEHEVSLKDKAKLFVYLDVLNTYMARSDIVWIYGAGSVDEEGEPVPPEPFAFTQLPLRPWVGVRIEW